MERQQSEEYLRLRDDAVTRLRKGIYHKHYSRKLQALVLPSFEDCCSYELLATTSRSANSALAVKTIWKRSVDVLKFQTPVERLKHGIGVKLVPTIEESENPIPANLLDALLERATLLRLPPCVLPKLNGLDGVSYEICFDHSFVWSRFKWWEHPPAGWEPLSELFRQIEALVCREVHLNPC